MRRARVVAGCLVLLMVACGAASSEDGGSGSGGSSSSGGGSTSSGGSSSSSGGSGGGSTSSGGAGISLSTGGSGVVLGTGGEATRPHVPMSCENPKENPYGGGFLICDRNLVHRPSTTECQSPLPRPEPAEPLVGDECVYDADCSEEPNAYCLYGLCVYGGCRTDLDCGAGAVCFCQDVIGVCVSAGCQVDADCPAGSLCAGEFQGLVSPHPFACQSPDDQCDVSSDCPAPRSSCLPSPRTCVRDIVG
jgi:hypothetical protein